MYKNSNTLLKTRKERVILCSFNVLFKLNYFFLIGNGGLLGNCEWSDNEGNIWFIAISFQ